MHWACPLCWRWFTHECTAGLLMEITGHVADVHASSPPAHGTTERNAVRTAGHDACTATTCADPRPVRQ